MKNVCLEAERLGFDLFTVVDHSIAQWPLKDRDNNPLESWTTLAGLAAVTNRIRLGPLVSCYAYRRPTVLAKMATTIDIISNGRLVFGIGAGSSHGWQVQEFNSFMGRFPPTRERLRGLEETVEICKGMFTSERTTYHGRLYKVDDALNSPQPIQKPIPIMIGGGGERRTLRIAAKHANISHVGFSGPASDIKILDAKLSALRKHCEVVGRDYDEIRKGTGFVIFTGHTEAESEAKIGRFCKAIGMSRGSPAARGLLRCAGTPDKVASVIKEYIDEGLGLITCTFYNFDDTHARDIGADLDDMNFFYDEVIPQLT